MHVDPNGYVTDATFVNAGTAAPDTMTTTSPDPSVDDATPEEMMDALAKRYQAVAILTTELTSERNMVARCHMTADHVGDLHRMLDVARQELLTPPDAQPEAPAP